MDIDVGQLSEAINDKADRDIMNLTTSGYAKGSGLAMPSNRHIDLTLGASGTTYTAPSNGYIGVATQNQGATGSYQAFITVLAENNTDTLGRINLGAYSHYTGGCLQPIKKGQKFQYTYESNLSTLIFRFIYAEGEE